FSSGSSGRHAEPLELRTPFRRDALGGPGRAPHLFDLDSLDPGLHLEPVPDVLADELHAGAGGGGERQRDPYDAVFELEAVDAAELDEADRHLRIHDLVERVPRRGQRIVRLVLERTRPLIAPAALVRRDRHGEARVAPADEGESRAHDAVAAATPPAPPASASRRSSSAGSTRRTPRSSDLGPSSARRRCPRRSRLPRTASASPPRCTGTGRGSRGRIRPSPR